jgi:AcrR family transcriptional regulator
MRAQPGDEHARPSVQPTAHPAIIPAAERILEAAARVMAARGATGLSMADVAAAAGVSKGLIHYHYRDKDALLARLAGWLADAVETRELAALAGIAPGQAVDALWAWLEYELALGDIRALLELARLREGDAPVAARAAATRRRAVAATTVAALFETLALKPRIPPAMLADVFVAFVDGLALDAVNGPLEAHRVSYDVFWLAMLSLAE